MGPPNLHFFRQRPLKVITEDGAPSVEKLFCVWNPKVAEVSDSGNSQQGTTKLPHSTVPVTTGKRKRTEDAANSSKPGNEPENVEATLTTSSIFQGARILARLVEAEIATLLFCRGRKLTELVLMNVHSILKADPNTAKLLRRVSSYRGGYTRRQATY